MGNCASDPEPPPQTPVNGRQSSGPRPAAAGSTGSNNGSKYRMIKELGQGAHGVIKLAVNLQKQEQVAIQFVERERIDRFVLSEVLNHRLCYLHPQIIQFKEVYITPNHLAIVMENVPGTTLAEMIGSSGKALSESDARWLFQQLILGIDYCHKQGIACRDIKPEHLVVDMQKQRPLLKICDFGFSKNQDVQSLAATAVGAPEYVAPEVLAQPVYDGKLADVWTCGVILYLMVTGEYPFSKPNDQPTVIVNRILKADYSPPQNVSPQCRDLLKRIFVTDPSRRLATRDVMSHAWYRKDLPEGVLHLNEKLLRTQYKPPQNEDEIRKVISEASGGRPLR